MENCFHGEFLHGGTFDYSDTRKWYFQKVEIKQTIVSECSRRKVNVGMFLIWKLFVFSIQIFYSANGNLDFLLIRVCIETFLF